MTKLGIIGLGLMGGSLGLALKREEARFNILGYARRQQNREVALRRGAVDSATDDIGALVSECNMLVCCLPVLLIPEFLADCAPHMRPGTVITDVGSTKLSIVERMREVVAGTDLHFVASHPICGSEKEGIENAADDLYDGAVTVITPDGGEDPSAVAAVADLWNSAGSKVVEMSPAEHDRCLARTSHLPHIAASLLASVVGRAEGADNISSFCGSGFRGTSRLAEGSPKIWRDIIQTNSNPIVSEIRQYISTAEEFVGLIERGDIDSVEKFLGECRSKRRSLVGDGDE